MSMKNDASSIRFISSSSLIYFLFSFLAKNHPSIAIYILIAYFINFAQITHPLFFGKFKNLYKAHALAVCGGGSHSVVTTDFLIFQLNCTKSTPLQFFCIHDQSP
ncbi:uncharacterized protein BYT42DRAFT_554340 [Radiomyces spectabilis]|uniref:uncharacterized protein n=1 Tax=Radiomyces spectabilis TaxID=64574 RepID=UPI00221F43FF|nr:uncharacterized protein BYT42DRAFT_554340 [Radiomyces spectabilis]KAI8394354.1 hypothetical protein BYT42DRAFT_554340 [Radiomyces spectabilis]